MDRSNWSAALYRGVDFSICDCFPTYFSILPKEPLISNGLNGLRGTQCEFVDWPRKRL